MCVCVCVCIYIYIYIYIYNLFNSTFMVDATKSLLQNSQRKLCYGTKKRKFFVGASLFVTRNEVMNS